MEAIKGGLVVSWGEPDFLGGWLDLDEYDWKIAATDGVESNITVLLSKTGCRHGPVVKGLQTCASGSGVAVPAVTEDFCKTAEPGDVHKYTRTGPKALLGRIAGARWSDRWT